LTLSILDTLSAVFERFAVAAADPCLPFNR
jgi:hypothetical protein